MPIREIARRTGLSRNTVKKYLAGNVLEPHYPRRRSPSALDAYALKLTQWLQLEASRNRKQRRSLKQLHADLVSLGYTGSYDRVTGFARRWKQPSKNWRALQAVVLSYPCCLPQAKPFSLIGVKTGRWLIMSA